MKKKILKFLSLWLPVIIWALIIFRLSSGAVPQVSSAYWPNFAFMKGAHTFFFGVLAALFYRALIGEGMSRKKAAIWAIIFTILYGTSDEFHQMFTQGREAHLRDILIDGVGASIATYLIYYILPKLPEKFKIYFRQLNLI